MDFNPQVQVPLLRSEEFVKNGHGCIEDVWKDSLMIPNYLMMISATILATQLVCSSRMRTKLFRKVMLATAEEEVVLERSTSDDVVPSLCGGIYIFKLARLIGCLALFALSLPSAIYSKRSTTRHTITARQWLNLSLCAFYFFTTLLSAITISRHQAWGRKAWTHASVLLLGVLGVYIYRDIFPLATFTLSPMDREEGWILWARISILSAVAIVIPLWIPHQFVPVDTKNHMEIPNPEQTASYMSTWFFFYLNPLVYSRRATTQLLTDDLPPICDYDRTAHLKKLSFPELDIYSGAKKRSLLWGLLKVFAWDLIIMIFSGIVEMVFNFSFPVSINRILNYIETSGKDAVVRPWLWLLLLFAAPIITSVADHYYMFRTLRSFAQIGGILTQLAFEHALRIRMKADGKANVAEQSTPSVSDCQRPDRAAPSPSAEGDASGKAKPRVQPGEASKEASNLVGKLNSLVTTDVTNIADAQDFILSLVQIPLRVTFCVIFLYYILGWSVFVGFAVMVVTIPLPVYLAGKAQTIQEERLKRTDSRVQMVTETLSVIRMIKLFGWERSMHDKISEQREEELLWIWRGEVLDVVSTIVNYSIPLLITIATYATYATKIFSSIAVFERLHESLRNIFHNVVCAIKGKVSLDRMEKFLHSTELIDAYGETHTNPDPVAVALDAPVSDRSSIIGFGSATFAWSSEKLSGTLTPSGRSFRLAIKDELVFKRGCINLIVGPTGSGKTSLLMALLGEMHFIPSGPQSWFHMPRGRCISYAAQESWIENKTIRENILFGSPYNEARYKMVLHQCALEPDLTLFEAGDATEVGEKGLTLSGGQKARISLARAVYSEAEIVLLDDVLAALDVHTSKWVVDKCFNGDLVKDRTILLVTHNIVMTRPVARFVVTMDINGTVSSTEDIPENLIQYIEASQEDSLSAPPTDIISEKDTQLSTTLRDTSSGKLILAEETEEGHVKWESFQIFVNGLSGSYGAMFFISVVASMALTETFINLQVWYLGYWASQYEDRPASEINPIHYLSFYALIIVGVSVMHAITRIIYLYGSIRASKVIHKQLIEAILGTTFRWLDTTPVSRVVARCTQDVRSVDGPLAESFGRVLDVSIQVLAKFASILLISPIFVVPGTILGAIGRWLGNIYIIAQLPIKREMSNAKAPVVGHFGAAMAGIATIRAYGVQEQYTQESMRRVDRSIHAERLFYTLNRWIGIRIDVLGSIFSGSLAVYLVYFSKQSAANIGFALNMAANLTVMVLYWVRFVNMAEVEANSLERIKQYLDADQEQKPSSVGVPPAYWPTSGQLVAKGLSARYSVDGPEILHSLNFTIYAGERIGVVGRTGSGKSTLSLSLLRAIPTEGQIYYDGIDINSLNLDALRSKITIIPQVPELFGGTLRQNLDPFDEHDDATLNDALRASGLFDLQNGLEENGLTLDSEVSGGGNNLSVGQRQILALARAIVRGSKLLILDEATSAIDYKTDAIIQSSLRNELKGDLTLITIAHRLQTIMDADRIMVLDAGNIVEFDSPKALLEIKESKFRALVDESSDKAKLYEMAGLIF